MDSLTKERRSRNMSRIRGKDTKPELIVRATLHRLGYRFRLHRRDLPGRPDIILPRHRTVILVHGCFWHRHARCKYAYTPKSNLPFWQAKFDGNIRRDRVAVRRLRKLDWRVVVIWECQVADVQRLAQRLITSLTVAPVRGQR